MLNYSACTWLAITVHSNEPAATADSVSDPRSAASKNNRFGKSLLRYPAIGGSSKAWAFRPSMRVTHNDQPINPRLLTGNCGRERQTR